MSIGITCDPRHGETGYRCPVGDFEQMAPAGAQVFLGQASRRRFGEAAQTVARARLAAETVTPRCEAYSCDVAEWPR
jgi:hypothetical protein